MLYNSSNWLHQITILKAMCSSYSTYSSIILSISFVFTILLGMKYGNYSFNFHFLKNYYWRKGASFQIWWQWYSTNVVFLQNSPNSCTVIREISEKSQLKVILQNTWASTSQNCEGYEKQGKSKNLSVKRT